jgi:hypothetical protein
LAPNEPSYPPDSTPNTNERSDSRSIKPTSITALVDGWQREAQAVGRKPSTFESYRNTIEKLKAFIGHDDAARVTPTVDVAFKDHRLNTPSPRNGKPPSAKTVKDSDLTALKAIFGWGAANQKIPSNPDRCHT